MERIKEIWTQFQEWVTQQSFYQELKARWEELDSQSQFYVKIGSAVGGLVLVLIFVLGSIASTYSLKSQAHQKQDLLGLVQQANDEMKFLRAITGNTGGESPGTPSSWNTVIEGAAQSAGIPKESIVVGAEKSGAGTPTAKETLLEIQVQKTNIRKLVKFAVELENLSTPLKIRHLQIGTLGGEGSVQATLAVSGFTLGVKKN